MESPLHAAGTPGKRDSSGSIFNSTTYEAILRGDVIPLMDRLVLTLSIPRIQAIHSRISSWVSHNRLDAKQGFRKHTFGSKTTEFIYRMNGALHVISPSM